jgi:hypothetical protein
MAKRIGIGALIAAALAFALAWASSGFSGLAGWGAFLGALLAGGLLLAAGLSALRLESPPGWLASLTVSAALLRLLAGGLWFTLLPVYGYATEVQAEGYVWEDAYVRDSAAWQLASSNEPLLRAFSGYRIADQYGGFLFFSAGIYRISGAETHLPLLIVVLMAALSALLVPFGWAFTRRVFGGRAASWAAWGLALYPEAVLLGGAQMREAAVMPLAAMALYGLVRYRGLGGSGPDRAGLAFLGGSLLLMLPLSPPYTAILVGLLALVGLAQDEWKLLRSWRLWLLLGAALLLVLLAVWAGWDQIAPRLSDRPFESPLAMAAYWLELSARWQARQTVAASGVLQSVLERTPEWFALPFILGYGVLRPLLPAQLIAGGNPLWWSIGVWRSAGWTVLLASILLSPLFLRRAAALRWGVFLAAAASLLIAAYWGGGDQWDNPRYRASLLALQVSLAAWTWSAQAERRSPWVRRALGAALAVLLWIALWYLRRYTVFDQVLGWTVVDVFKLLAAGLASGGLYVLWDWAGEQQERIAASDAMSFSSPQVGEENAG